MSSSSILMLATIDRTKVKFPFVESIKTLKYDKNRERLF
jgi:hypothetical protein